MSVFDLFRRDRRGNVAVIFGLAAIPIVGATGIAVDYGRASMAHARLADVLDAAVLAVGSQPSMSDAAAKTMVTNWVGAQLGQSGTITSWKIDSFTQANGAIRAAASAEVQTTLTKLLGVETMPVSVSSEAVRSGKKIELALVLDNTGSMDGTKIASLITAAKNLVDTLAAGVIKQGDLRVSLVPFSQTVNVGSSYRTASWMDTKGLSPIHSQIFDKASNRFSLFDTMKIAWRGCVETRPIPYDVQDTLPSTGVPSTLYVPFFAPDEPDVKTSGYTNNYTNNYLADGTSSSSWKTRELNSAKYSTAFTKTIKNSTTDYGPNSGCAIQPLLRLSSDTGAVKSAIGGMIASGDTNIPIGLAWGWNTLAPDGPFADGVSYADDDYQKIVVLMTDGQNQNTSIDTGNQSYYSSIGYIWNNRLGITSGSDTQRRTAMDNRLSALCTNVKARGVQIYTVRVEVKTGTSTVLQNCASRSDMFYDVQDASQLNGAFQDIAGEISKLRLSK
ncbi:MAG TPA: pilus assembly protein [Kaistia sp.]|nr:pilus assembly protein [Kaistia sp.]